MAERLHIIMPSNRPWNIARLSEAYLEKMEPHPFELRWHIMLQGPEPDPKGTRKTNEAIDFIPNGWLMMLADDTDQHPALFRRLGEVVAKNPDAGAVVFSQDRYRGKFTLHAHPNNMTPCHVCGSQVVWNREFLGSHRYEYEKYGGTCDGELIKKVFDLHPERFVFVDEVLIRFGSLEW